MLLQFILGQIGQLNEAVDAAGKLTEGGIVSILIFIIIAIVLLVVVSVSYVLKRLLGSGGIVDRVANAHISFLEELKKAIKQMELSMNENVSTSRHIDSTVVKLHAALVISKENLEAFRRIWKFHVQYLRKMSRQAGFGDEVTKTLDEMENLLNEIPDHVRDEMTR